MRFPLLLAGAVLAALLVPCVSAAAPTVAEVRSGDPDLNDPLVSFTGGVGFFDADNDGRLDVSAPDEPAYLDLDNSHAVSYGDLRLVAFGTHPAGTVVLVPDTDVGRPLATPTSAWFTHSSDGGLAVDMDGGLTLSPGDLAFPAGVPTKVQANSPGLGGALKRSESSIAGAFAAAQRERSLLGTIYVDLDAYAAGGGRVSAGDVRITPQPSPAAAGATPAANAGTETVTVRPDGTLPAAATVSATWRGLDWMLVSLAVVNLGGLLFVIRILRDTRPRNPF